MKKPIVVTLLVSVVGLIIVCVVSYGFPSNFYCPGNVCKAHQNIKDCGQCHIPFKGASSSLCMSGGCHSIDRLSHLSIKTLSDVHISYVAKSRDCLDCHTEHKEGNIIHHS